MIRGNKKIVYLMHVRLVFRNIRDVSTKLINKEKESEAILNFFPQALGNELKPFLMNKRNNKEKLYIDCRPLCLFLCQGLAQIGQYVERGIYKRVMATKRTLY